MDADSQPRLFAALGDATRWRLMARLAGNGPMSIAGLTAGSNLTRQAISKHLRVLQASGLLRSSRRGRERLWQLDRRRLHEARLNLALISQQWDTSLEKLKAFVEK